MSDQTGTPARTGADAVRFLASPAASFVTGQSLPVMGPLLTPEWPDA